MTAGPAAAGEPDDPAFLLSSGIDVWRYGAFLYGGLIWSPRGLDKSGFTLKTLIDGGRYDYLSGGLLRIVDGTKLSAAVLPGWRFVRDSLNVTLFAGPVAQNYRLSPNDPGSRLNGRYLGAEFAADIWYQPTSASMAALGGAVASIGPTGYLRAALGIRAFSTAFVGPETKAIWSGDYSEYQLGAHVTGVRIDALQWSAGGGYALTTHRRGSPYAHLDINVRY